MQEKKRFIAINKEFKCQNCEHEVQPAQKTCRNHCTECLHSLHVDDAIPGDRASSCHGLMKPITLTIDRKKGYIITHECTICSITQRNKTADDDNFDVITQLMADTNHRTALGELP